MVKGRNTLAAAIEGLKVLRNDVAHPPLTPFKRTQYEEWVRKVASEGSSTFMGKHGVAALQLYDDVMCLFDGKNRLLKAEYFG